jgi:hypothetical protein
MADGIGPPAGRLRKSEIIMREALQQWLLNQEAATVLLADPSASESESCAELRLQAIS